MSKVQVACLEDLIKLCIPSFQSSFMGTLTSGAECPQDCGEPRMIASISIALLPVDSMNHKYMVIM